MNYIDLKAFCRLPFHRMKVASDGTVNMCSYQAQWGIGNILTQSFEEVWLGKTARDIREEVLRNRLHPNCATQNCPFISTTNKKLTDIEFNKYPIELEIDLPMQHCNTTCIMCERNLAFKQQPDKLNEICSKLKPYVPYLRNIIVVGIAEPFWQGKIYDILEQLDYDKYKDRIGISTITNGTVSDVLKFLKYEKSCITFSLDAATEKTHKLLRETNYNEVINILKEYSDRRQPSQRLRIHNNINLFNIREVEGMVETAKETKVDELEFNATAGLAQLGINADNANLFFQAQQKIIDKSKELGVNTNFVRNLYLDFDIDKKNNRVNINVDKMAKYLKLPKEDIEAVVLRYNKTWLI